jgi:hypothetical protein
MLVQQTVDPRMHMQHLSLLWVEGAYDAIIVSLAALSHPDLRNKAGCISYVRQGRTTHIITECIEVNVINIINVLIT